MSGGLKITLRAGERIFINGGVLKADRKVGLELMNDVVFLLEQHVMKAEDTTTPLKQLYFMIQMMLMDPALHQRARAMANESVKNLIAGLSDARICQGLQEVSMLLGEERPFEALKKTRALIAFDSNGASRMSAEAKEVA